MKGSKAEPGKRRAKAEKGWPGRCPSCGSDSVIPILYGLPIASSVKRAEMGEFVLGGCMIEPDSPRRQCKKCGKRF